ncbi:zinc-binding dehydrogenase [Streptomyces sp. NPDC020490]|uniref:zinc-binding dehydrogenase n=1 Tax=Streptomyces sp. NPDC020490 TaxID=3365078 RepID=UPI0037BC4454
MLTWSSSHGGRFSEDVREATDGRGADMAIDIVGGAVFQELMRSLRPRARWIMVGELSGETVTLNPAQLILRGLRLRSAVSTTRAQLEDALALIADGAVRTVIREVVGIQDVPRMHEALERRQVLGRAVAQVGRGWP